MNVSEMRPPPGGFEGLLEAELVKVVKEHAARPRSRRRRAVAAMRRPAVRVGVLTVATAVAAAAGFAFGGISLSHRQAAPPQTGLAAGASPVHIRTAAFSVDKRANGTIRVTWDKRQYMRDSRDPANLQQALRAAGLPVLIKVGVFCAGPGGSGSLDAAGVGPGVGRVMTGADGPDGTVVFTFTPSAMPPGEELFIGYLSPAEVAITQGQPGSVERLVPTGVPLTCTSQLPLPHTGPSNG